MGSCLRRSHTQLGRPGLHPSRKGAQRFIAWAEGGEGLQKPGCPGQAPRADRDRQ